jgi:hypothetical protein
LILGLPSDSKGADAVEKSLLRGTRHRRFAVAFNAGRVRVEERAPAKSTSGAARGQLAQGSRAGAA